MHEMWHGCVLSSTLFDVDVLIYMSLTDHYHLPVGGKGRGDVHVHLQDPKVEPLMILSG